MKLNLTEYLRQELSIKGLEELLIDERPLWRIVRSEFRDVYMGGGQITVPPNVRPFDILLNVCRSAGNITKVLLCGKKCKYIFLPHPRLFDINGMYMDRLTDPLIDYSDIKDEYIILERHQNGTHKRPRYHSEKVVYLDVIDVLGKVFGKLLKPYYARKYRRNIEDLINLLKTELVFNETIIKAMFERLIAEHKVLCKLIYPLLNSLSPKYVFYAPRDTFFHVVDYCKKRHITCCEMQHGVVVADSLLYTGIYNRQIDPDYFLVFGKDNISRYFGLPLDLVKNVGFPFKNYVNDLGLESYGPSVVLFVSEPQITNEMIGNLAELATIYPQFEYHIRLHPHEDLSTKQRNCIDRVPNMKVVDNSVESFCALSRYTAIVGENSSVLYEAMSLGKKVGRFNYGGLVVIESQLIHGGTVLNSPKDFYRFMNESYDNANDSKEIYSDYQRETMKQFV